MKEADAIPAFPGRTPRPANAIMVKFAVHQAAEAKVAAERALRLQMPPLAGGNPAEVAEAVALRDRLLRDSGEILKLLTRLLTGMAADIEDEADRRRLKGIMTCLEANGKDAVLATLWDEYLKLVRTKTEAQWWLDHRPMDDHGDTARHILAVLTLNDLGAQATSK